MYREELSYDVRRGGAVVGDDVRSEELLEDVGFLRCVQDGAITYMRQELF